MLKSRRWGTSKPPVGVEINLAHPLATSLRAAWLLAEGGGLLTTEAVWGLPGVFSGVPANAWRVGPGGLGLELTGAVSINWPLDARLRASGLPVAWAVGFTPSGTNSGIASDNSSSGTAMRGTWIDQSAGFFRTHYGDGDPASTAARRTKTGTTTLAIGRHLHLAASMRGPTNMSLYIDGIDDGGSYGGSGGDLLYSSTFTGQLGRYGIAGSTNDPNGNLTYCYYWHRDLRPEEARWIATEPYAMFQPLTMRRYFIGSTAPVDPGVPTFTPGMPGGGPVGGGPVGEGPAPGGQIVEISIGGTITAAGALSQGLQVQRAAAGTITPLSLLRREVTLPRAGTCTPTGTLLRQVDRSQGGTLGSSSTLVTVRAQSVTMDGVLNLAGAMQRTTQRALLGTLGLTGVLLKRIDPLLQEGFLGLTGLLRRVPSKFVAGGPLAPAGTLDTQAASAIALDGTLPLTGTVIGAPIIGLTGTVTANGVLQKQIEKNLFEGFLMSLGALAMVRSQSMTVAGTLTPAGALDFEKDLTIMLDGAIAPSGTLSRTLAQAASGTITGVGTLAVTIAQHIEMAGTLGLSGTLTVGSALMRLFTGTLHLAGALTLSSTAGSLLGLVTMVRAKIRATGVMDSMLRATGLKKPRVR